MKANCWTRLVKQALPLPAALDSTRSRNGQPSKLEFVDSGVTLQELARAIRRRLCEEQLRFRLLNDAAAVEEDDFISGFARKTHLMGHHDHGEALACEPTHNLQDFSYQLGIK